MDKKGAALRNFVIFIFLLFLFGTFIAGGYSYYVISQDKQKLLQKDREIEKLNQSANLLDSKLAEIEAERKKTQDQVDALRGEAERFESEKKVIINQVQSAVANFDTYQKQSADEIERLKASVTTLETEKKNVIERLETTENLSRQEKEQMSSEIKGLNEKIETHKKTEVELAKEVEARRRTAVVSEAVKLHYNLGNFYFRNRQYKAAAKEYEQAVYFAPDDAASHFNLAVVTEEYLGDSRTAAAHYKKYLELVPDAKDFQAIERHMLDLEMNWKVMDVDPLKERSMDTFGNEKNSRQNFAIAGDKK